MDIGDQVLYIFNDEIDLDRDLGEIISVPEDAPPGFFMVRFADKFTGLIHDSDLRRVKTRQEKRMHRGYFGCLDNPCPEHHSTKGNEG